MSHGARAEPPSLGRCSRWHERYSPSAANTSRGGGQLDGSHGSYWMAVMLTSNALALAAKQARKLRVDGLTSWAVPRVEKQNGSMPLMKMRDVRYHAFQGPMMCEERGAACKSDAGQSAVGQKLANDGPEARLSVKRNVGVYERYQARIPLALRWGWTWRVVTCRLVSKSGTANTGFRGMKRGACAQ
jgi:hypothetical protein